MNKHIDSNFVPGADLEHLKKQAKSLLKSLKAENPHAIARLGRANLNVSAESSKLSDAQRVIAHENGCSTWAELRQKVESGNESQEPDKTPITVRGINQIWLDCSDLEETDRFYGELLGIEKSGEVPGQMLFFECGGVTILIGLKAQVAPNSILYLDVGDSEASIQHAYNRLKDAGVSVGDSPHCIAKNWNGCDVWMAFFKDPSGNQLAFKANVPAS